MESLKGWLTKECTTSSHLFTLPLSIVHQTHPVQQVIVQSKQTNIDTNHYSQESIVEETPTPKSGVGGVTNYLDRFIVPVARDQH